MGNNKLLLHNTVLFIDRWHLCNISGVAPLETISTTVVLNNRTTNNDYYLLSIKKVVNQFLLCSEASP